MRARQRTRSLARDPLRRLRALGPDSSTPARIAAILPAAIKRAAGLRPEFENDR
jgi:hypothetical protein